jgi:hypothetical protein
MAETRKQRKDRLKSTGSWEAFVAKRDQLVRDGMTPADAREEAACWAEAQRYLAQATEPASVNAPIDRAADHLPAAPPAEHPDFSRKVPNAKAVEWVAQNLANPDIRAADAPAPQAWALLCWVRRSPANETTFWGSIWPKLSSKREQEAEDVKKVDEGTERVRRLLEKEAKELEAWMKERQPDWEGVE